MKNRPLWPLLPPLALTGAIYLFPAIIHRMQGGSGTTCAVHAWSGLHCPGCGGTRCAEAITSGQWITAMGYNPLLATGFLVFMAAALYLAIRMTLLGKPAPALLEIPATLLWAALAAVLLFTVLRNIPQWPFTLLAP